MTKIISAISKYVRVSPTKINLILSKIRGKTYKETLEIFKYLPQRTASIIWKTIYSAVSNASKNFNFKKKNIIILEAFVNKGPGGKLTKRVRFINKGRQAPIEKKFSHITISVSENV
jgi:large subunit ribosomal protein L22